LSLSMYEFRAIFIGKLSAQELLLPSLSSVL